MNIILGISAVLILIIYVDARIRAFENEMIALMIESEQRNKKRIENLKEVELNGNKYQRLFNRRRNSGNM